MEWRLVNVVHWVYFTVKVSLWIIQCIHNKDGTLQGLKGAFKLQGAGNGSPTVEMVMLIKPAQNHHQNSKMDVLACIKSTCAAMSQTQDALNGAST